MKIFIFIFLMLSGGWLYSQNNFYNHSVVSTADKVLNMSAYKDRKVLIVVASPAVLSGKSSSRYLGKIQATYPELSVLIIPARDIGRDSSGAASFVAQPVPGLKNTAFGAATLAGKDKGSGQHPLLRWLTNSGENRHFDASINDDEQFFVISESGVLYAVLGKGVPDELLKMVLEAPDIGQQQLITDINRK